MSQRGFAPILIILLVAIIGIAGAGFYFYSQKTQTSLTPPTSDQIACTQDAKLCPDGSSIGRSGPKCEFKPCPTTESTSSAQVSHDEYITSQCNIFKDIDFNLSFNCPVEWYTQVLKRAGHTRSISVYNYDPETAGRGAFKKTDYKFVLNPTYSFIGDGVETPLEAKSIAELKESLKKKIMDPIYTERVYSINGFPAYYIEIGQSQFASGEPNKITYILDRKGKVLEFENIDAVDASESSYNQILSTFKFLP